MKQLGAVRRRNYQMQDVWRIAVVFVVMFAALPAVADKASSLYDRGRDGEAREDYEAAYTYYAQAYQLKPKNLTYRAATLRMRVIAGSSHVHRGQLLRDEGRLEEALVEFQKAAQIDPASFIAQQEIHRTLSMIEATKTGNPPGAAADRTPIEQRLDAASGPVELAAMSNAPITLNMTQDAKIIWTTLGKLAGLNVAFDPDYTSRHITVDLTNVTLPEALQILSMESKAFWRPVTPNTIFVAADTQGKRKDLEQNVLMTFYLSNMSQPTDLQDVVSTLHTALDVSRLTPIPSQNAVVVRGTPDQIALAAKLIGDMDKARPEVVVDVMVLQVNKDRIRNLGVSPPTSTTVALQGSTSTTSSSTTTGTGTGTTATPSTGSSLSLNDLSHLNATNFAITIPSASASFLASDSDSKLIQNPQIRALDGQKASLKIGQRVPVATGSYQSGIAGGVNTQFQYIDVGVNVDITPRVHANNDVTLKVTLEISSVDSTTTVDGVSEPVIGQRKIDHEIRLKEGEANVVGGMLTDTDTKSSSGYPWLSSIPFLKYFFSAQNAEKAQTELVFVLIPRVVRGQDLNTLNMKPLDIGTSNAIELRRLTTPPSKATTPAGPQATPVPGGPAAPAQPPAMPAPQAAPPAAQSPSPNQAVVLGFNPAQMTATVGQTFTTDVVVNGAQNLFSVPVQLQYDPSKLELVNVSNGAFLAEGGQAVGLVHRDDPATGVMRVTASRPPNSGGVSGQGSVFTLTFMAKAPGQATIAITRAGLKDANNQSVPANGTQQVVDIRPKAQ